MKQNLIYIVEPSIHQQTSEISISGYKTYEIIGSGGYGDIYAIQNKRTMNLYAIKTENYDSTPKYLQNEINMILSLPSEPFFPSIIKTGKTDLFQYYIMPLYGPSFSALRREFEGEHFSASTTYHIAIQTLNIINCLHKRGIVHCDIKPCNFVLNPVYIGGITLIDYGLSSNWLDPITERHIPNNVTGQFKGTIKYASLNVHNGNLPSRRDDLISWFYSILELLRGKLPWGEVRDRSLIFSCKQSITADQLCHELPHQMKTIWNDLLSLSYDEEPNYSYYSNLIKEICQENNINDDDPLDWVSKPDVIAKLTYYPEFFDPRIAKTQNEINEDVGCLCVII